MSIEITVRDPDTNDVRGRLVVDPHLTPAQAAQVVQRFYSTVGVPPAAALSAPQPAYGPGRCACGGELPFATHKHAIGGCIPRALPLGPGEDDAEVWIPPATDCMEHRPDRPCPYCGDERLHHRTWRCGGCGRRPGSAGPGRRLVYDARRPGESLMDVARRLVAERDRAAAPDCPADDPDCEGAAQLDPTTASHDACEPPTDERHHGSPVYVIVPDDEVAAQLDVIANALAEAGLRYAAKDLRHVARDLRQSEPEVRAAVAGALAPGARPATADQHADLPPCSACGHPIDPTARHVVVMWQVEQHDPPGQIHVRHTEVLTTRHEACA